MPAMTRTMRASTTRPELVPRLPARLLIDRAHLAHKIADIGVVAPTCDQVTAELEYSHDRDAHHLFIEMEVVATLGQHLRSVGGDREVMDDPFDARRADEVRSNERAHLGAAVHGRHWHIAIIDVLGERRDDPVDITPIPPINERKREGDGIRHDRCLLQRQSKQQRDLTLRHESVEVEYGAFQLDQKAVSVP